MPVHVKRANVTSGPVVGLSRHKMLDGTPDEILPDDHPDVLEYRQAQQVAFDTGNPIHASEATDFALDEIQFANFLDEAGIDDAAWDAAIDTAYTDKKKRKQIRNYFRKKREFRRDDKPVDDVLTATGIDKATLDAAWLAAKDITYDA